MDDDAHDSNQNTTTTTSIELDFQLDNHGRTTLPQSATAANTKTAMMDYSTRCIDTSLILSQDGDDEGNSNSEPQQHFYFPSSSRNSSSNGNGGNTSSDSRWYDDVLLDCEIADSGLMPRTFWVPAAATAAAPRCTLEQWALDIFHHHVHAGNSNKKKTNKQQNNDDDDDNGGGCAAYEYDPLTSGAEWWVQIRPQLNATGRYEMHASGPGEYDKNGICFHWDKDEDLRLACGGNLYIHPHVSTVTYLTSHGAPTMVVEQARIHPLSGTWLLPNPTTTATTSEHAEMDKTPSEQQQEAQDKECQDYYKSFISWPSAGKHLSFDGRFLHAAPSDLILLPSTTDTKQGKTESAKGVQETTATTATISSKSNAAKHASNSILLSPEEKRQARRGRRITFLVNIWLNYKPLNVEPFPETMLDKMSGSGCRGLSPPPTPSLSSCSESAAAQTSTSSFSTARPCLRFGKRSKEESSDRKDDEKEETNPFETTCVTIANGQVLAIVPHPSDAESSDSHAAAEAVDDGKTAAALFVETFTWPMGSDDAGESIQMQIPLHLVREHQAQLDTTTSVNRGHVGGNIHIHYVPPLTGTDSNTSSNDTTAIINLGVVLLKNGDTSNFNSTADNDDSTHLREKRTFNDDDDNDIPLCAKRPNSDNHNSKSGDIREPNTVQ